MSAIMAWPPTLTGISLEQLRRLQGAADVQLAKALTIRAKAASTFELLAAHEVVEFYRQVIAACRRARAAHARATGWHRPTRATSPRRDAAPSPTHADAPPRTPARAAGAGGGRGVAGVKPPPGMGHGWPASGSGAGSAAALSGRNDGTPADSVKSARHPENPSFCPSSEGISNEINA